jgi:serine/threonine-protein kinase
VSSSAGRIGPYRLIAKLEQGGMAEVHLAAAEDRLGSHPLRALKLLPRELLADPHLIEMFRDEARLAVRFNHPNVVQTMEVGEHEGAHYLAMELLEGETVQRLVQRAQELAEELPARAAIAIVMGVLQGLHYIHELKELEGRPLGIVHRDVTPSNLHVSTSGTVKLCDFGIAKTVVQNAVTLIGMRKGKLAYLAPEQLLGVALDGRADVYACGVVLWELLSGRRLFEQGRGPDTRARRLDEVLPNAPPALVDVCSRALAHARADRYATALDMWNDLDAAARALGGPTAPVELGRWVERLVGEDVKNLRRLAANALRDGRAVDTLDRPTTPPEATSYTLLPRQAPRSRAPQLALAGVAIFAVVALVFGLGVLPTPTRGAAPPPAAAGPAQEPSPDVEGGPPSVRVVPTPPTARVRIDGLPIRPGELVGLATRGRHRVEVDAEGYAPRTVDVDVQDDVVLQIDLGPAPEAPADSARPVPSSPAPAVPRSTGTSRPAPPPTRVLDQADPW